MTEAKEIAGQGVKAKVDGHWVLAGNKKLMDAENVNMYQNAEGDGKFGTVVYIAVDGKFRGHLVISDEVKPTSKQAIIQPDRAGRAHRHARPATTPRVARVTWPRSWAWTRFTAACCLRIRWQWVEKLLTARRPRPSWPSWATASTTPRC